MSIGIDGPGAIKPAAVAETDESPWLRLSRTLDQTRAGLERGGRYFADLEFTDKKKAENREGLNLLDRVFINTKGGPQSVESGFGYLQNSYLQEPAIKWLKIYRDDGQQGWLSIKTPGDQLVGSIEVSEDPATMKARVTQFLEQIQTHVSERDAARAAARAKQAPAGWGQK